MSCKHFRLLYTHILGILRSDYMLHEVDDDSRDILQVEINTIASSFGSLSTKISDMHRFFYQDDEALLIDRDSTYGASKADNEVTVTTTISHSSSDLDLTYVSSNIPKNIALGEFTCIANCFFIVVALAFLHILSLFYIFV